MLLNFFDFLQIKPGITTKISQEKHFTKFVKKIRQSIVRWV